MTTKASKKKLTKGRNIKLNMSFEDALQMSATTIVKKPKSQKRS